MRRTTPGNVGPDELLPFLIRRAESYEAAEVIRKLEPLVTERRRARMQAVIAKRLASVAVLFDAPHDPHNGAAIIRSCEAFGVQTLHVIERVDPFLVAPSVTKGAEKWVDVHAHKTLESALPIVRAGGFRLVAAHPEGELLPQDLASMGNVVVVLGNERDGIGDDLLAACDARARVPMRGFIDSLNVSVTAAIMLSAATQERPGDLSPRDRDRLYARGLYLSVEHADVVLADP